MVWRGSGPPGAEEQGRAVIGSPGKLGEPPVSSGHAGTDHTGSLRSKVTDPLPVRDRQESGSDRGTDRRA